MLMVMGNCYGELLWLDGSTKGKAVSVAAQRYESVEVKVYSHRDSR